MGSIGDPWDNALAENFIASPDKKLGRRERLATREGRPDAPVLVIECFDNTRRRHSGLGHLAPPTTNESTSKSPFRPSEQVSSKAGRLRRLVVVRLDGVGPHNPPGRNSRDGRLAQPSGP